MLPRWLVTALAILISVMWAANLIIGWRYPGRSEPSLNAIFAIVAGAVFALQRFDKNIQAGRQRVAKMLDPHRESDDEPDGRGGQS